MGTPEETSERRVLVALGTAWALTAGWFLFWPVPTEVIGRGVVIVPGAATVIDARAEGQILSLPVRVGQQVRRGQTLLRLYLPTLEQQLRRQEKDLAELIRINADLDRRDQARLASARRLRDTALAQLEGNRERLDVAATSSDEVRDHVAQLERLYDAETGRPGGPLGIDLQRGAPITDVDVPSGDELAAEIERFLRGGT